MDVDLTPLAELAVTAVSVIGSVLLTIASLYLKTKWGLEIEAKHREALHSALETGARKVLAGRGASPRMASSETNEIVSYAHRSTPDAIKSLGPNDVTLGEMAEAKMEKVVAEKSPVVASPKKAPDRGS